MPRWPQPPIYVVGRTAQAARDWVQREAVAGHWAQGQQFCYLTSEDSIRGLHITEVNRIVYVGPIYERKDFQELEWALRFATKDPDFTRRIEYVD